MSLTDINQFHRGSALNSLGIVITALGADFISAEMPVDERTVQPYGILHGGSSILLAESLGSVASTLKVQERGGIAVGIEVNGSHVSSARSGKVTGTCRALRTGNSIHFWHIEVRDEDGDLCCDARLTIKILWPREPAEHSADAGPASPDLAA